MVTQGGEHRGGTTFLEQHLAPQLSGLSTQASQKAEGKTEKNLTGTPTDWE